jgi:hypothetical protein
MDVEEKCGKGDNHRKAQNHPEECLFTWPEISLQGQNFCPKARISAPRPEFPPLDKIFGGRKFYEIPSL